MFIYLFRAVCTLVPLHTLLLDCTVHCHSWHAKVSVLGFMHSYCNSRWKGMMSFMSWQLYPTISITQYLLVQRVRVARAESRS